MHTYGLKTILLLLLTTLTLTAQQKKPKNYTLKGYIKDLRTLYLIDGTDNLTLENRIHNRLNFKWYLNDNWTFAAEARTQLIYGEFPKIYNQYVQDNLTLIEALNQSPSTPYIPTTYGEAIAPVQTLFNLSTTPIDEKSIIWNSYLDRIWIDYYKDKFQMRIGRQRINWGKNWIWNPNDLFNNFSFLDFDYEERPGSDAIRLQYYPSTSTEIDFIAAPTKDLKTTVIASRVGWNKWDYDFQALTAYYKDDIAVGIGWAGNIKNAGFKGEITYFQPLEKTDTTNGMVAAIGFDYSFKNSLIVQGEFLYNHFGGDGSTGGLSSNLLSSEPLSPKNLWTYRYAIALSATFPVHPLVQTSAALIFHPADQSYFIAPTITWSLKENLDLTLIAQFTQKQTIPILGDFTGTINTRFKWSF